MMNPESHPGRELLRLSIPLVISFWLRAAFSWVDAFFASRLELADESIAAIGLTLPFEFLMIACWVGTSNGLTARLAAAMGSNEGQRIEQLKEASRRIIRVLNLGFFVVAALCYYGADKVGLEPGVAKQFRIYATITLAGSGITSFWSILPDSLVKAHQDTRSTMWAGLLSSITNVVLNALFVFGFGWGIYGIALSTVIGRLAGLAYALKRAHEHEHRRIQTGLDNRDGLFDKPIAAIMTIAVPAAIAYALLSVESLAVNAVLSQRENATEYLAAWSIYDRAARFLAMPIIALGVAILPYSARLYGQGRMADIAVSVRWALLGSFFYLLLMVTPLCLAFGPWLAAELSKAELTRELAEMGMFFVPMGVLALGPLLVMRSVLEGLQCPRPGLVVAIVRSVFLVVPMTILGLEVASSMGYVPLLGAYTGNVLSAFIAAVLLAVLFRRVFKRCHSEARSPNGPTPNENPTS